jgi:hypothetical protein
MSASETTLQTEAKAIEGSKAPPSDVAEKRGTSSQTGVAEVTVQVQSPLFFLDGMKTQASLVLSFLAFNVNGWFPRGAEIAKTLAASPKDDADVPDVARVVRRCTTSAWLQTGALLFFSVLQAPLLLATWLLVSCTSNVAGITDTPESARGLLKKAASFVAKQLTTQPALKSLLPKDNILDMVAEDGGRAALPLGVAYLLGQGHGAFMISLLLPLIVALGALSAMIAAVFTERLLAAKAK